MIKRCLANVAFWTRVWRAVVLALFLAAVGTAQAATLTVTMTPLRGAVGITAMSIAWCFWPRPRETGIGAGFAAVTRVAISAVLCCICWAVAALVQ